VLLSRKGAVLVLAEPEARRPIGRETCNAVSAVQRGQRGDYGHVVGVPALVAFCGVGRLPPHRRRQCSLGRQDTASPAPRHPRAALCLLWADARRRISRACWLSRKFDPTRASILTAPAKVGGG
jgi:hypothetical protein